MNFRIFFLAVCLTLTLRLDAGMARVVGIHDERTLVVERGGVRAQVSLAGVSISDAASARALLEWTLARSWVMVEEQRGGGAFVYRSPDALFVNRELVQRGFAHATLPDVEPRSHVTVTYLGRLPDAVAPPRVSPPRVSPAPRSGTSSGTPRRPSKRPSRRSRPTAR